MTLPPVLAPAPAPAPAPGPTYACELVQAQLQLCNVNAAAVQPTSFATCAAAAMGVGTLLNSPVVPRSVTNVPGVRCSAADAPSCCCDMAALVAFDVVAADMNQAEAYTAAVPNLNGQAMLQCLKVMTAAQHKCIYCFKGFGLLVIPEFVLQSQHICR